MEPALGLSFAPRRCAQRVSQMHAAVPIITHWMPCLGTVLFKVTFRRQNLGVQSVRQGSLVVFEGSPGIGRVSGQVEGAVEVEFFESAAEPRVGVVWKALSEVRRARLGEQSRVFFRDGMGR